MISDNMRGLGIRLLVFLSAVTTPLLVSESEARAEWRVCNNTGYPVQVAIGYQEGNQYVSEGWWKIGSGGQCKTVKDGALQNRYYYFYADHLEVGGSWDGDYNFCVTSNAFTIVGDENCSNRGYRTKGFELVDTGPTATSWTTTLTD